MVLSDLLGFVLVGCWSVLVLDRVNSEPAPARSHPSSFEV